MKYTIFLIGKAWGQGQRALTSTTHYSWPAKPPIKPTSAPNSPHLNEPRDSNNENFPNWRMEVKWVLSRYVYEHRCMTHVHPVLLNSTTGPTKPNRNHCERAVLHFCVLGIPADRNICIQHIVAIAFYAWPGQDQETHGASSTANRFWLF